MKKMIDYAHQRCRDARSAILAGAEGAARIDAKNALTVLRAVELVYSPTGATRDRITDLRRDARRYLDDTYKADAA